MTVPSYFYKILKIEVLYTYPNMDCSRLSNCHKITAQYDLIATPISVVAFTVLRF